MTPSSLLKGALACLVGLGIALALIVPPALAAAACKVFLAALVVAAGWLVCRRRQS